MVLTSISFIHISNCRCLVLFGYATLLVHSKNKLFCIIQQAPVTLITEAEYAASKSYSPFPISGLGHCPSMFLQLNAKIYTR